jgi:2-isopropylmalate synthase
MHVQLYDTTLRDGSQGEGVNFSVQDKLLITRRLDELGFDFIEGGFAGSNEKDSEYFERVVELDLKHAQVCAFGMTRRRGVAAAEDPGMRALLATGAPICTVVGKTWDLHVTEVLRVSLEENLAMIRDSVAFLRSEGRRVFYDAEHFFDGFAANPEYGLQTILAAQEAGAQSLALSAAHAGGSGSASPM